MTDYHDWDKLTRFLRGDATTEEAAEMRRWMAEDPSRQAYLDSLERVWEASAVISDEWDVERAVRALSERTDNGVAGGVAPRTPRRSWRFWHDGLARAASIVLLLGVGVAGGWLLARQTLSSPAEQLVFTTGIGERRSIELKDGTRVVLNVNSRMRVSPDFDEDERNVTLQGEALFEVERDAAVPFFVRSQGATTRVVGTRFNVRAYAGDNEVEVVVVEGRVAVTPGDATEVQGATLLTAGQLGRARHREKTVVVESVDPSDYVSWTEGRLVFRDTPLTQVLERLEHWYEIDLQVADNVLGLRRVTTTIDLANQSVGEVLGVVALSVSATYRVNGRTVVFNWKDRE